MEQHNTLKHIEINIGKACNNKCRFCMSAGVGYDELQLTKIDVVIKEIDAYAAKGYKSIGFLGGDISIHPNIYDIIVHCKESGFVNINVITNAMIFDDYSKAQKLIESGVTRVNISIHSHKSQVEDFLTQIPGGLSRKLKAIDNFNKLHAAGSLRSPLSINIVLNKQNLNQILETCMFFYQKMIIKDMRINFLWNRYFFESGDKEKLELSYSEFLPYLKKLVYISVKYNIRITFDSVPACIFYSAFGEKYQKITQQFIGEPGDHIEEISNLNKDWNFDWKKQKEFSLKQKQNSCKRCAEYVGCQGVWNEYIEKYGFEEFEAIM